MKPEGSRVRIQDDTGAASTVSVIVNSLKCTGKHIHTNV